MRMSVSALGMLLCVAIAAAPARAGNQCPPPPNPNDLNCPLDPNRSTLRERDLDGDGAPDNDGQAGGFCGGVSPAECGAVGAGVQIALDLVIPDPQNQAVTCSIPSSFGNNVFLMIMGDDCDTCVVSGFGEVTLPAGTQSDSTLKLVVSDDNGDVCPCVGVVTCTYSVEAICDDGADGDGDGLIDGDDPDCCVDADYDGFCGVDDCDDANAFVHSAPRGTGLDVIADATGTLLRWDPRPGNVVDVVGGYLDDLLAGPGFELASCLFDDLQGTEIADARPDPLSGEAYYYLARQQNSCGASGFGQVGAGPTGRAELDGGPCTANPNCDGCVFGDCDLLDPQPVCGDLHCLPLADGGGTFCNHATGPGTQGASCDGGDNSGCAAGFLCSTTNTGNRECRKWCDRSTPACPFFTQCVGLSPPVVIDGTEYGICLDF